VLHNSENKDISGGTTCKNTWCLPRISALINSFHIEIQCGCFTVSPVWLSSCGYFCAVRLLLQFFRWNSVYFYVQNWVVWVLSIIPATARTKGPQRRRKSCRRHGKRYTACGVWLCMIPCFNEYHSLKHVWFSISCVIPQLVVDFGVSHFIVLFGVLQFIVLFTRTPGKQSNNFRSLF